MAAPGYLFTTVQSTGLCANRRRVEEQCERAARGELAFHVQPGHPLGFLDVSTPAR
jgi:hypothetical protein